MASTAITKSDLTNWNLKYRKNSTKSNRKHILKFSIFAAHFKTSLMKKFLLILAIFFGCICFGFAQNANYTSLNNSEFAKVIKQKKVQLVDVRSEAEYAQGHLAKAINIDVNKNFNKQAEEKLDKKKPVAVYCASGARSKSAAYKLSKLGFETIYELNTGIRKWDGKIVK